MGTRSLGKAEIEFPAYNEDLQRDVVLRRTGRVFRVGGVDIVLFPISVLAEALERDPKTIRRWEREKKWPKPQWKAPGDKKKRWYSASQIMTAHRLYRELNRGDWGFGHSRYFPIDEFLKFIRDQFYLCDTAALEAKESKDARARAG